MKTIKIVSLFLVIVFIISLVISFFIISKNRPKNRIENFSQNRNLVKEKIQENFLGWRQTIPQEKIQEFRLEKLTEKPGLVGLNETDQYVEEIAAKTTTQEILDTQISNYQTYVTPNDSAVQAIAKGKNPEQIYQEAISWVWVDDETLNQTEEKWLLPNTFLTQTPNMKTNPAKGRIASDCESQAYTLVSALRASGMPAEKVRVVTGKVNFGGSIGGHAWVEVFDEKIDGWFQLEATSGDYYDEKSKKVISSKGIPYDYFKEYQYPSINKWTMFNDKYFFDITRQQGVAPEIWFDDETVIKKADPSEIKYQLPETIRKMREEKTKRLLDKFQINPEKFQIKINQMESRKQEILKNLNQTSSSSNSSNLESENIENQIILIIDNLEKAVEEGMTEEQKIQAQTIVQNSITKAYKAIEQSNLDQEQKNELEKMLKDIESKLESGLSQAEVLLIKKKILNTLNQLEENIKSGETTKKIENLRNKLRENIQEKR